MGGNMQAKTKLPLFPSQERERLWTQIWLHMQSTCQHDYTVRFVYTILKREAVGIDHFTLMEYTDKKQGVEWPL